MPQDIVNHTVSKKFRRIIYTDKDENGNVIPRVKVKREPHVRIQVLWKNGETS